MYTTFHDPSSNGSSPQGCGWSEKPGADRVDSFETNMKAIDKIIMVRLCSNCWGAITRYGQADKGYNQ